MKQNYALDAELPYILTMLLGGGGGEGGGDGGGCQGGERPCKI